MKRYTYEGGRQIYLDGEPFISVGREGDTVPTDADEVARIIVGLLNRSRHLPKYTMERRARRGRDVAYQRAKRRR